VKIGNVREVRITDDDVIVECGVAEPHQVEFRRGDVYFASCELCSPPPAN
jgi:hypothetical protein